MTFNCRVAKTYIWYNDECYFVSTIERDSSAMEGPERLNETIVWEYNWDTATRGKMIHVDSAPKGSLNAHQAIVNILYVQGPEGLKDQD